MSDDILQQGNTQSNEQPTPQSANTSETTPASIDPDIQLKGLQEKLDAAQKLADTYKDQLLRKAAEFDNYRKRSDAEYAAMVKYASESLMTSLIPILDDFARSLKAGREIKELDSLIKGVELIHAKFVKLLESRGLVPFDSVGRPFDVEYHDALLQVARSDVPPQTVVEEIERGYKLFDKVVRHAKVIVSAEPEPVPSSEDQPKESEKD